MLWLGFCVVVVAVEVVVLLVVVVVVVVVAVVEVEIEVLVVFEVDLSLLLLFLVAVVLFAEEFLLVESDLSFETVVVVDSLLSVVVTSEDKSLILEWRLS